MYPPGQQTVQIADLSNDPYAQQPNPSDPNVILNDCRAIGRDIDELGSRLGDLERSQSRFITSGGSSKEVDSLTAEIMGGYHGLTNRVKGIKSRPESRDYRNKPQVDALDLRLRTAIKFYQVVENKFQKDVQKQLRRQFLIVRPDATEEEIQKATSDGTNTQIFEQALMNSDRRGQAQSTLSNVRQRHTDIQRIERTILELQQLFQDLDTIVVEQGHMVQNVEQKADNTHEDLVQGNVQIDRAIARARAARRRKWIYLGVCVAVVLVILIIILIWAGATGQFVSVFHGCEVCRDVADDFDAAAALVIAMG
jgi:syntaxin 1B/2/3